VDDILSSVNEFLNDIQNGISLVTGTINGISIPDIGGSITSALSFENITFSIFGCDISANCPASDYYTLQDGSGAAEEPQQPRFGEVNQAAINPSPVSPATEIPFAPPRKDTPNFDPRADASSPEQVQQRTRGLA
jgi:hypothetical protein